MLMLSCTKILRPGLPRIGKLGKNIVLPRTVDLASLLGGVGGFLAGLAFGAVVGRPIFGSSAVFGFAMGGVPLGLLLVRWRPWRGEHIGRVALVRSRAALRTRPTTCPGSGRLPLFDAATARWSCQRCGLLLEPETGLAPRHQWRRRLYVGMQEVAMPETGPVRIVSGSVPVAGVRRGHLPHAGARR